jgi:hypothetical protein
MNACIGGYLCGELGAYYDDVQRWMDLHFSAHARMPQWVHQYMSPEQLGEEGAARACARPRSCVWSWFCGLYSPSTMTPSDLQTQRPAQSVSSSSTRSFRSLQRWRRRRIEPSALPARRNFSSLLRRCVCSRWSRQPLFALSSFLLCPQHYQ